MRKIIDDENLSEASKDLTARRTRLSHISFNRFFPHFACSRIIITVTANPQQKQRPSHVSFCFNFLPEKTTARKYRVSIVFGTFFMISRNFFYIFLSPQKKKLILCITEHESVMGFHIVKNTHRKVKTLDVSLKRLTVEKLSPQCRF